MLILKFVLRSYKIVNFKLFVNHVVITKDCTLITTCTYQNSPRLICNIVYLIKLYVRYLYHKVVWSQSRLIISFLVSPYPLTSLLPSLTFEYKFR